MFVETMIFVLVGLLSLMFLMPNLFYGSLFNQLSRYLEIGHAITAGDPAYEALMEASQCEIGGTSLRPVRATVQLPGPERKPLFRTLHVEQYQQGAARWRLRIRFLLANQGATPIVLDDMHAVVYERNIKIPTFMTVSYRGEVLLQQDNTIYKEERAYSLEPGDGMEITLALNLTRVEGAPLYGVDEVVAGPVTTVFGLLTDYYELRTGDVSRSVLPSDCLYVFQYDHRDKQFKVVDDKEIEVLHAKHNSNKEMSRFVEQLEQHLKKHRQLNLIPRI